jgi:hypothetical protein
MMMRVMTGTKQTTSTHPHADGQLFVRWVVGAPGLKKGQTGMTMTGEGQQEGEEMKAGEGRQGHTVRQHPLWFNEGFYIYLEISSPPFPPSEGRG